MPGNVHSLPRQHLQGTEPRTCYGEKVSESLLPVPRGMRKRVPVMPCRVMSCVCEDTLRHICTFTRKHHICTFTRKHHICTFTRKHHILHAFYEFVFEQNENKLRYIMRCERRTQILLLLNYAMKDKYGIQLLCLNFVEKE